MSAGSLQITKSAIRAIVIASLAFGVANCSKRDPRVDTQAPAKSPSPTPKPPFQTIPGGPYNNNATPYRPGSPSTPITPITPITPGTPRPPYSPGSPYSPGYPNNNSGNNGVRPPGANPLNNNNYVPPRPNVMPPAGPNIIPNPPVVPGQPPAGVNAPVNVAMQLVMTQDGPKVKAAIPATVSAFKLQYVSVTGMTEGTTADVAVSFTSGGKACSRDKMTVGAESQNFSVPCK